MTALDWFGRRMLAWPTTLIGVSLVNLGGVLLLFAAWLLEIDTEAVE